MRLRHLIGFATLAAASWERAAHWSDVQRLHCATRGRAASKARAGNDVVQCLTGGSGCWNPARWRGADAGAAYARFWRGAAARVAQELDAMGARVDHRYARATVVHLRCSDVPFSRRFRAV